MVVSAHLYTPFHPTSSPQYPTKALCETLCIFKVKYPVYTRKQLTPAARGHHTEDLGWLQGIRYRVAGFFAKPWTQGHRKKPQTKDHGHASSPENMDRGSWPGLRTLMQRQKKHRE